MLAFAAWSLISCSVWGVIGWFVLMFIGTNLVGMSVGGLAHPVRTYASDEPILAAAANKSRIAVTISGWMFSALTIVYLALTWIYINPLASVAATMLVATRIPDVLFETRAGRKMTAAEMRTGGVMAKVMAAMDWLALLLLIVGFCWPL